MKRLLLIGITLLFNTTLFADGTDPLWGKYINAKVKYQDDLAALFAETHPELKDLIVINHDLQVTMTLIRQRRFYYLLEINPYKIIRNQGISKWTNFNWSEKDEETLVKKDPKYAALSKVKDDLYEKNQGHPDWPAYRKAFTEEGESQRYKDIHKAFMDVRTEIDSKLKKTDNQSSELTRCNARF